LPIPLRAFSSPAHSPHTGPGSAHSAHFSEEPKQHQEPTQRAQSREREAGSDVERLAILLATPLLFRRIAPVLRARFARCSGSAFDRALALGAPWTRRRDGGSARRGAGRTPARFSSAQEVLSKNPAIPPRTLQAKPAKRVLGVALLFGYFLLGTQEKVTRPSADGRNARRVGEQPGNNAQPETDNTKFQPTPE
jgi:hypothetical protein